MKHHWVRVRTFASNRLARAWPGLLGIALATWSPLGLGLLAVAGVVHGLRSRLPRGGLELAFLVFTLSRIWTAWRMAEPLWLGAAQGVLAWLLFRGAQQLLESGRQSRNSLALGTTLGLMVTVGAACHQVWTPPAPTDWILDAEGPLVKLERSGHIDRLIPTNPRTAYVVKALHQQGSGEIEFSLEIRTDQTFEINYALIHAGLPSGRIDQRCPVRPEWTTCLIRTRLPNRQPALVSLGGFDTWKGGSPSIEVKNAHLKVIRSPGILERLHDLPRTSGWVFNPNAFGALSAVLVVLVLIIGDSKRVSGIAVGVGLLGVVLSGSRTALLGLILSVLMFLILKSHRAALLASVLGIITVGLIGFSTTQPNQPVLRAINIFREDGFADRRDVYSAAWQVFVESPITGAGQLQPALQKRFDQEAARPGKLAEAATHAHNLALQTVGEGGLLSLAGVLTLWASVSWYALQQRAREHSRAALLLLMVVGVLNTFDYLFYFAPVYAAFGLAAALATHAGPRLTTRSGPMTR
jgi:O-antigen ligase